MGSRVTAQSGGQETKPIESPPTSIKRWPLKVKDLNDSWPLHLRQTAWCSHDQTLPLANEGGCPVRPRLDQPKYV